MTTDIYYQITIQGHLDRHWSDWFDGLRITHEANGTTTLAGPLADQTALHGVLIKFAISACRCWRSARSQRTKRPTTNNKHRQVNISQHTIMKETIMHAITPASVTTPQPRATRRYGLILYFVAAYAWQWLCLLISFLMVRGQISLPVPH